jgi:hypothetical protein
MANFDLNSYETVEQRHARAIEAYPDLRCVLLNHSTPEDREKGVWVVEARVYLSADDQANDLPKATEWAFEIDGQGMANKTSALENANTSALGRALRWALGGSRGPSREEMQKVARSLDNRDWITEAAKLVDVDKLRMLWQEARQAGAADNVLTVIKERADGFKDTGDSVGGNKATK